jgi:hypothetical protein
LLTTPKRGTIKREDPEKRGSFSRGVKGEKMQNLICAVVLVPIAYVTYTRFKESKEAGKKTEAILWMTVSVIVGSFAVVSILAAGLG